MFVPFLFNAYAKTKTTAAVNTILNITDETHEQKMVQTSHFSFSSRKKKRERTIKQLFIYMHVSQVSSAVKLQAASVTNTVSVVSEGPFPVITVSAGFMKSNLKRIKKKKGISDTSKFDNTPSNWSQLLFSSFYQKRKKA